MSNGVSDGVRSDLPTPRGDLADLRPVVAIDSREQQALCFTRLESRVVTLPTADYGLYQVPNAAAIERKASLDELISCLSVERDRFERELMRMKAYPFRRLIVIGSRGEIEMQRYRSRMAPRAVLATLSAFEVRYDLPICYFPTPEAAALQVESWLWWIAREIDRNATRLRRTMAEQVSISRPENVKSIEGND
jgi:DNA excision repair protein ERCC-4